MLRTLLLLPLLLPACKGDDPADGGIADWGGGTFQVSTLAVRDACFDGALAALFMPQGADTPQVFEYDVYLPAYEELPLSYSIDLREPFVGMPLTMRAGDGGALLGTGTIEAVLLNADVYGDCVADMDVAVTIAPQSSTTASGAADITIRDLRGDEGRCPVPDADPCVVALTLSATLP